MDGNAAKQGFRYLNGTVDEGITFNGNLGLRLKGWSHANWGAEEGNQSQDLFSPWQDQRCLILRKAKLSRPLHDRIRIRDSTSCSEGTDLASPSPQRNRQRYQNVIYVH